MDCIQLSLFGRTCPEPFPATTERTSGQCWKNLPALDKQTLLFLDLRGGGRWSKAGAIAGNGWSLAWRQLDSQYFGVAQRRKRIALILDLRGQRAGEILFERTSLSRHPDPCIQAWKEVAGLTANCPVRDDRVVGERSFCIGGNTVDRATKQNGMGVGENISFTIDTVNRHAVAYNVQEESPAQPVVLESNQIHATVTQNGICPTLPASMGLGGGYVPMVTDRPADKPVVFENHAQDARYKEAPTCSPTVVARWGTGGGNTPLVAMPERVTSYGIGNGQAHAYASKEKSGTLDTMHDAQAVAIKYSGCLNPWDTQARRVYGEEGTFPASFAKAMIASMKAKQQKQSQDYLDKVKKNAQDSGANGITNPPPANPEPEDAEEKSFMNSIRKANGVK